MTMKVAFLGLGTMGAGMVRNLLAKGFGVIGWNRTPAVGEALASETALQLAETPELAASEAEVAITCLGNDAAVEQVVLGERGVLAGLREGGLLIDCGTTSAALTRRLDAACVARGIEFLDAPITGSKLGAAGGRLTFMVGGPGPRVERATPLFTAMGHYVVHVGEAVGKGQAVKLCLNLVQGVVLEGVLEGFALARMLDVPLTKLADVLEHSAGRTGVGAFKTPYLLAGDFDPHFRLDLMHKDLHMALARAEAESLPLPAASTVRMLYDMAMAEGLGGQDFLATVKLLERWLGQELREES